jgi:hypothetical protein
MYFLKRISESVRFWQIKKYRKRYINPEIRELLENFYQKKRVQVDNSIKEEDKVIENIKNSYEYKSFEHFRKIEFLKTKEKSADFIKYCDFKIFFDKKRWTLGPFFIRHFLTPKDFIFTKINFFFLFLLALFAFKLGLINGLKDSQLYDEIKENILDVRTEDQLLSLLTKKNMPILVLYYIPGDSLALEMQMAQGKFIEKWGDNYITMAKVNCKYNLELCIKKVSYLNFPQWELMYPPFEEISEKGDDIKKFPVLPCKFNRSIEGIEGFLMEQGLIPDKYNPVFIVSKAMRKYI